MILDQIPRKPQLVKNQVCYQERNNDFPANQYHYLIIVRRKFQQKRSKLSQGKIRRHGRKNIKLISN